MNSEIPKYMKAAVLWKTGEKLLIKDRIEIPKLKAGQVLVKLAYSGVCQSQLMELKGLRGKNIFLPHLLGHEGCGRVVKISKNVKKVKKNDWVVLGWIKGNGRDVEGAKYKLGKKIINSGPVTTFSTYSIVSENRLILLPPKVSKQEAVLFGCAFPTGVGMIFKQIDLKKNHTIAIIGIGGVGLFSLIAAKVLNCKKIIAIDNNNFKLNVAKKNGANYCINSKKYNINKAINKITKFQGVDYCIDTAGNIETIEIGFDIINKKTGLCIFCSHPSFGKKIRLDPFELISGKKIIGSWGGGVHPDRDIPRFVKIFQNKKISFKKLIQKKYRLDQINKALEDLDKRRVLRPLIAIDENL